MSTATKIPEDYAGNDPAKLADQIEKTLFDHERGDDYRDFDDITFFEGELKLIIEALRVMSKGDR